MFVGFALDRSLLRLVGLVMALLVCGRSVSAVAVHDEKSRGQLIYEQRCISCHGVNGQGTPQTPAPIFGDRSLADLADLITRTMPEGSPEDCVGDDAVAVAEWMQQAFYSPEAQTRLNPPRQIGRAHV